MLVSSRQVLLQYPVARTQHSIAKACATVGLACTLFWAVCVRAQAHDNHQVVSSSEFVMSTRWNVVRLSHNTTVVHRLNPTYTCIHTIHATGLSCNIIWYIHRCCPKLPLDQSMILIKREATTVAVRPPPRQANPLRHSLAAHDGDAAVRSFAVPERPLLFAVE